MTDQTIAEVTGSTSDGFHTFDELYEQRAVLFAAFCRETGENVWRSRQHPVGGPPMYPGMFIVGVHLPTGDISFHVEDKFWYLFVGARTLDHAPHFDGHTSADVLERIKDFIL